MRALLGSLLFLACFSLFVSAVSNWEFVSTASPDQVVPISVALTLRNKEWLQSTFEEVSNPRHENWRKFVTKQQIKEKTAPKEANVQKVMDFLRSNNAITAELQPTGDFIIANFKVRDVERMLNVRMNQFKHKSTKQTIFRSKSDYTLPSELRGLVDIFGMVSEFPQSHLRTRSGRIDVAKPAQKLISGQADCPARLNWGYPASSDVDLYSQVQIVCCNGQYTRNLTAPCYDVNYPNVFTAFVGDVVNNVTSQIVSTTVQSYDNSTCFDDGTSITCNVLFTPITPLQPYQNFNLIVYGVYGELISEASTFPTALVTSPFVTPQYLNDFYEVSEYTTNKSLSHKSQSVVEFGGQYYSPSDLSNFLGNMSLPNNPAILVGENDPSNPGDEATLDVEWIMAVSPDIDTVFWSVKTGYLLEWCQQLLAAQNTPLVNSVSYAGNENDSPIAYRDRVDLEFQKLGAVGVSIVVASGDAGATDVGHGFDACSPFQPQYPATSPFVTSVSATYYSPSSDPICSIKYYGKPIHCSASRIGEVAVTANLGMDWTTGGGFSNHVPRPSWQANAVNTYLSTYPYLLPPSNYFNSTNRGYPDVSANGHNLLLINKGQMDIGDGTSAATPIFTGILSLVNNYLLSKNQNPVGFASPLLYEIASISSKAFYDVTVGNNKCGDVLHPPYIACCEYGYEASNGWDPVTGLGTPRLTAFLEALDTLL